MLANECFGGNPPRSWERIIRRSTSSIPSQRYASVAEFVQAIRKRHGINVLILVLVSFVLLILAATIQTSWHYALLSRSVLAPSGRARSPSAPPVTNRVSMSSSVAADTGDFIEVAPDGQTKRGGVTNKVFMVPDDDHAKSYPKAGVFVGDRDPNF